MQNEINRFTAETVADMTTEEYENWRSLSDFERKTIAATAYFFVKGYNEQQTRKALRNFERSVV